MTTPRIEEMIIDLGAEIDTRQDGDAFIRYYTFNDAQLEAFTQTVKQAGRDEERKRIIKIASRGKDAFMVLPTLNRFIKALQDKK